MKIYYINLDSRIDRNSIFIEQFENSKLVVERIAAVSSEGLFDEIAPAPVSACWHSHLKAYRQLLESKEEYALIFEDDAKVNTQLIKVIQKLQTSDKLSFDLLQLGYLKDKNKITVDSGKIDLILRISLIFKFRILHLCEKIRTLLSQLLKIKNRNQSIKNNEYVFRKSIGIKNPLLVNSIEAGAHCYVINKRLASILLNYNVDPVILATDLLLIEIGNSAKYNCFRVSKSLCDQNNYLGSNINVRSKGLLSEIRLAHQ